MDNPWDPARCDPACKDPQVCYQGRCTLLDASVPTDSLVDGSAPKLEGGVADTLTVADICPSICRFGCQAGSQVCRTYTPSNAPLMMPAPCGPVLFVANGLIDTTTCQTTGAQVECTGSILASRASGPKACVMNVVSFQSDGTVQVRGKYPLIVLARLDVTLKGLVDAAGSGPVPGPGGSSGGVVPSSTGATAGSGPGGGQVSSCTDNDGDDFGGGGGGYGSVGAAGGRESDTACTSSASNGGSVYGTAALVPLVGGSGGGSGVNLSNNQGSLPPGSGGGGGGAIQFSTQGRLDLQVGINAGGGGGSGGPATTGGDDRGGGGGGSGGAILLEAPDLQGSGVLAVNGGGGGGGCNSSSTAASSGGNGGLGLTTASGGTGAGGAGGTGGSGAASSTVATQGQTKNGGGGGGGGGLGRIRVNCLGCSATTLTWTTSGSLTVGTLTANP